jgi:hypothetical protein
MLLPSHIFGVASLLFLCVCSAPRQALRRRTAAAMSLAALYSAVQFVELFSNTGGFYPRGSCRIISTRSLSDTDIPPGSDKILAIAEGF